MMAVITGGKISNRRFPGSFARGFPPIAKILAALEQGLLQ
jgi:hypothetical protein